MSVVMPRLLDCIGWMRVAVTMIVLAVASMPAVATAGTRDAGQPSTSRLASEVGAPLVVVRALGPVEPTYLQRACDTISRHYPLRCQIRPRRRLLDHLSAWRNDRGQLDARAILDEMFRARASDALVELLITPLDIYDRDKTFVFGLASMTDRVGIVSLARITDDDSAITRHRMHKLVLHEVGHGIGLPHHADPDCIMRQDSTPFSLDSAPGALCEQCHRALLARTELLARPGQIALDRTRGHLARSEVALARRQVIQSLRKIPMDPEVLNGFALAFMEAEHWNEAVSLLSFTLKRAPRFAKAHVNLGVTYQLRDKDGDLQRALEHFQAAIRLRPQWAHIRRHLRKLRRQTAQAQGPQ